MLRNTFINSQMGPIPPPNQEDPGPTKPRAIKWIDEDPPKTTEVVAEKPATPKEVEQKKTLVTNKSCEDLVHKKSEELVAIDTHRDATKQTGIKRTIKQFVIDRNKLTGLRNFTEISPDPLALPHYALPPTTQ